MGGCNPSFENTKKWREREREFLICYIFSDTSDKQSILSTSHVANYQEPTL